MKVMYGKVFNHYSYYHEIENYSKYHTMFVCVYVSISVVIHKWASIYLFISTYLLMYLSSIYLFIYVYKVHS